MDEFETHSYGRQLEEVRLANTPANAPLQTGVDVEQAEQDFSELNRQFSSSHQARRLSHQVSRVSKSGTTADVEKAASTTETDASWDLETALHGQHAAEEEAGIKGKHIGGYILIVERGMVLTTCRCDLGQPICSRHRWCQDHHQDLPRCNCRFFECPGHGDGSFRVGKERTRSQHS